MLAPRMRPFNTAVHSYISELGASTSIITCVFLDLNDYISCLLEGCHDFRCYVYICFIVLPKNYEYILPYLHDVQ